MSDAAVRGVLFDLDGTLVDTERLQWEAYRDALREHGVEIDLEEYRRHWIAAAGGSEYACRTYALSISPAELRTRKAERYRRRIGRGVDAMPGAHAALERLRPAYRLAVATNTVRAELDVILGHTGLGSLLDTTIAREDYAVAKPAPDAYLVAAAALGLPPAACVVVEDTERGTRSGLAAGMRVLAVPSDLTRDNDFRGAARILPSLDALTPRLLDELGTAA